jgi:hypothetical protein
MQLPKDYILSPLKLPRVLVVNIWPFNMQTNMGQTLHSVFRNYPVERLACIDFCPSINSDLPDPARSWRMARPILDGHLLRPKWRRLPAVTGASAPSVAKNQLLGTRSNVFAARLGPLCNALAFRIPGMFRGGLKDWIDRFQPQLLFSQAAPGHILPVLGDIGRKWGLPIAIHVTDDWVSWYPATGSIGRSLLKASAAKAFSKLVEKSKLNLVISDAMAQEYSARYGGKFEVLMNPYLFTPSNRPVVPNDPFILTYTGVLEPDRWTVLRDIGRAIDSGLTAARLEIRAPDSDVARVRHEFFGTRSVVFEPFVSSENLESVLTKAHVLVHVESFSALTRTRLSMSTKIGSYLAAGRPILAIGPLKCASIQYLKRLNVGPVLEFASVEAVNNAISRMRADQTWTLECAARARAAADLNHNPDNIRRRLWAKFQSIVEAGDPLRTT